MRQQYHAGDERIADVDPVSFPPNPMPHEQAQAAEIRRLRVQVRALEQRLAYLQQADEAIYRLDHRMTGGPVLDPGRPFGTRRLGTLLPASTRVVIWRMGRM
ncbi:hypothetical protein ACFRFJ_15670 [Streptomyces hydrogenans]|uniref:hypothetical protein n=1 Tax=Streptomyces hydrogenans TaxID=1873719 RepID=UPI00369A7715